LAAVGVVAIGRNEGERLRACLASALRTDIPVVYVDSGSIDGSAAMAKSMGASVVELDMSIPFSAARARNEGFKRLMDIAPDLLLVMFVDGDCEIVEGFVDRAAAEFPTDPRLAVVCGRRRERFPDATLYNKLCDIEWNTPIGPAKACGGDAVMRVSAFREVGGFDSAVIAGEEPELCVRLRVRGWRIVRIDADMTIHDAAITRFGQWWKRNVRAGHAYAQGAAMHGRPPQRHWVKEVQSNLAWGLALPLLSLAAVALAPVMCGLTLIVLLAWPPLFVRIWRNAKRRGVAPAATYALVIVLGKIPQALGQIKYWTTRLRGSRVRIIEYKSAAK
jgi:GT2 family glycosyltransferase